MKKISLLFIVLIISFSSANRDNPQSWGYQLQDYDIESLKNYNTDILVIDYSKDGSDENKFTKTEIEEIKDTGKLVLSYISIGEAEDYRYYFETDWLSNSPVWFDRENPDWKGNYKVKYWIQGWKDIIFGYLDKIAEVSFDGVYLDIIDAYEFYEEEFSNAKQDMINFVIEISEYLKSKNDYLIFPQNGEKLLADANYLNAVDGIGREDVYIIQGEGIRDASEINEIEEYLDLIIEDNKTVLTVDYTLDTEEVEFARSSAQERGYLHYIGVLELDYLVDQDNYSTSGLPINLIIFTSTIVLYTFTKRSKFRNKSN